jgi:5-methylcytosine-specific restriction endonuclease McrA
MLHNHQYRGLEYGELLSFPQWKKRRKQILLRDGRKCRSCGDTGFLQVHHRQYHVIKSIGKFKLPWKYEGRYLITLCEKCHTAGHSKYSVPVFSI